MKRMWRTAVAVAASGLAVAMFASPTAAAAPTGASVAVHQVGTGDAAAKWTPEAMRDAIPLDRLLPRADASKLTQDVRRGAPQVVQPTSSLLNALLPQVFPEGGGEWTGGGAVESTAGRVFFTYGGRQASCSGNAVTSGNKSVVMTAGHCVKLDGAWHTDWVFVPAYDNGNAPFGTWSARATMATPQWVASEDINYDVGAAVVSPLNGQSLTDVVGGQGIAFNQERGQDMYAFGWPAADPYDGTAMIYCSGTTFDAFISDGIGMTCDMTGGASGGPWFLSFDEGTGAGIQNSVNSYKINLISIWMFGPYFGSDAQGVYNTAQAA
ncbi:MAG: peptidase [Actinophytocola sp.]|uniref:trypsin-like serine peptidase n=1 Tax=Actinophytocola sp. TaxID=1872138 RepID=UPI001321A6C0|nr:peptidase [Actinophytocola sp.]MPZ81163.1 peptidase [Actinophytocola sp.]